MPAGNRNPRRPKGERGTSTKGAAARLQHEVYRLELVRLRGEALSLTRSLNSAEALTEAERKHKEELLGLLLDRVRLFVHLTEDGGEVDALQLEDGMPEEHTDFALTTRLPDEDGEDDSSDLPPDLLSLYLARRLREHMKPTLEDQLDGMDSPIQPPGVITQSLEAVLEKHMMALSDAQQSSLLEMGKAMVALQRGLAIRMIAELASSSGQDANEQTLQATAALASASSFELVLFRAKMHGGSMCTVHYLDEAVELHVSKDESFLQLCADATRYWHLEAKNFFVSDQHGAIWLAHMQVLEALRLAPPNTTLWLRARYKETAETAAAIGNVSARQLKQRLQNQAESDEQTSSSEADVDVDHIFDADDKRIIDRGPRTRSEMVFGLLKVIILAVTIYFAVDSRTDIAQTYEMCSTLRGDIVTRPFPEDDTVSYWTMSRTSEILPFLTSLLPSVLWQDTDEELANYFVERNLSLSTATEAQKAEANAHISSIRKWPRVGSHNYLLGGVRLRQQRVQASDAPQCVRRPFLSDNELDQKGTYTEAQTVLYSIILDAVATLGWEQFIQTFDFEDLALTFVGINQDVVFARLDAALNKSVPRGFAYTLNDGIYRRGAPIEENSFASNITRYAALIDAAKYANGNISLCYPEFSSSTESREPFGPLRPDFILSRAVLEQYFGSLQGEGTFQPKSSQDHNETKGAGILSAWMFRTAAQIGDKYRFRLLSYHHDADAFTYHVAASNMSKQEFATNVVPLFNLGWLDRATRTVKIDLMFFNPNTMLIALLELRISFSLGASMQTQALCGVARIEDPYDQKNFATHIPDIVLAVCLLVMTWDAIYQSLDRRGIGVVFVRSGEQVFHLLIFLLCGASLALRYMYVITQRAVFERFTNRKEDAYDTEVVELVDIADTTRVLLALAFWLSMARVSFYYSLFSTRFYLLRKAISVFHELIPALVLGCILVLAFGFFAHSTFGSTTRQWATLNRSFSNLVIMFRKPSIMDLDAMEQSDPLKTYGFEGIIGPIFFMLFTFCLVILLTALARAVVIRSYSRSIEEHDGSPPADIVANSPWPTINVFKIARERRRATVASLREARVKLISINENLKVLHQQKHKQAVAVKQLENERKQRLKTQKTGGFQTDQASASKRYRLGFRASRKGSPKAQRPQQAAHAV